MSEVLARVRAAGIDADTTAVLARKAGDPLCSPEDVQRLVDAYGYDGSWRTQYSIGSVARIIRRSSLTCIDSMILSYFLVGCLDECERVAVAVHRRDAQNEECGHVVTAFRRGAGGWGAVSKSSYPALKHCAPIYSDPLDIAVQYAQWYLEMGMRALYCRVFALEDVAADMNWISGDDDLTALSARIVSSYTHEFVGNA
jgi:hypothetical protein